MLQVCCLSALAAAALLAGCAATPPATPTTTRAASADCRVLASEMREARAARQAAVDAQSQAWKGVLPPIVIGRYVSAASDAAAADDRIGELQRHVFLRDCHAG
jgi:hypothetical protein